jgi:tRNA-dihydrouridine synthase A
VALRALATAVIAAGADELIVHARKAWLKGLSPRENRDIPPLDYRLVYRLKTELPHVPIIINGGIASLDEARQHLQHVDGVMLGRAAYKEPWRLLAVDAELFGEHNAPRTMKDVLAEMVDYIESEIADGTRLHAITRHLLGAFHAVPGARAYRRYLAENAGRRDVSAQMLREAVALIREEAAETVAA